MARIKAKTSGVVVDEETTMIPEENTAEGVEDTTEPIIPDEDNEVITESPVVNDEVLVEEDIIQKAPVKNVKVLPKRDHTCVIGGTRYCFRAGVQQNVPVEVKDILVKADLLSPL